MTDQKKAKPTALDKNHAEKLKAEIKEYKKANPGFTQLQLAQKLGISNAAVSQYANGNIPISMKIARDIAIILNIHPSRIHTGYIDTMSSFEGADAVCLSLYVTLSDEEKETVRAVVHSLSSKRAAK